VQAGPTTTFALLYICVFLLSSLYILYCFEHLFVQECILCFCVRESRIFLTSSLNNISTGLVYFAPHYTSLGLPHIPTVALALLHARNIRRHAFFLFCVGFPFSLFAVLFSTSASSRLSDYFHIFLFYRHHFLVTPTPFYLSQRHRPQHPGRVCASHSVVFFYRLSFSLNFSTPL
jgi:hypothetical protein